MTPPPEATEGATAEAGVAAFRVTTGFPTEEELAAVVAVLSVVVPRIAVVSATVLGDDVLRATPAAPDSPRSTTTAGWSAYGRGVRSPLRPGPGAWRTSGGLRLG